MKKFLQKSTALAAVLALGFTPLQAFAQTNNVSGTSGPKVGLTTTINNLNKVEDSSSIAIFGKTFSIKPESTRLDGGNNEDTFTYVYPSTTADCTQYDTSKQTILKNNTDTRLKTDDYQDKFLCITSDAITRWTGNITLPDGSKASLIGNGVFHSTKIEFFATSICYGPTTSTSLPIIVKDNKFDAKLTAQHWNEQFNGNFSAETKEYMDGFPKAIQTENFLIVPMQNDKYYACTFKRNESHDTNEFKAPLEKLANKPEHTIDGWFTNVDRQDANKFEFPTDLKNGIILYPKFSRITPAINFTQDVPKDPMVTDTFDVTIEVTNADSVKDNFIVYPSQNGKCVDDNRVPFVNQNVAGAQKFNSGEKITLNVADYEGQYVCAFVPSTGRGINIIPKMSENPVTKVTPTSAKFVVDTKEEYPANTTTFPIKVEVNNADSVKLMVFPSIRQDCKKEIPDPKDATNKLIVPMINDQDLKSTAIKSLEEINLSVADYEGKYVCLYVPSTGRGINEIYVNSKYPVKIAPTQTPAIEKVKVIFKTGTSANDIATPPIEINKDAAITRVVEDPTKTGHKFLGWHTDINKEDTKLTFNKTIISEDTTFIAKWEKLPETKPAPVVTTGGSGGGGYITNTTTIPAKNDTEIKGDEQVRLNTTNQVSEVIFKNFAKKCEASLKDLTDPRLTAYYTDLQVLNTSNTSRKLTRAEFVKLTLNAANIDVSNEPITTAYSDVDANHSLAKYISYATRIGMISGNNGKFSPNAPINRAEAAKIFVNSAGLGISVSVHTFSDVDANHSLARFIQTAYDNCIVHGRKTMGGESLLTGDVRVYEPADGITLAEAAKVLYNINH